jgi:selenocysteine-specific elongation factor
VRVRGLQSLGNRADDVRGVARVALNLRGVELADVARGMALIQAGQWTLTKQVDVRVTGTALDLPAAITVHVGAARAPARVRVLGDGLARLALRDALPLHAGERVLLRDPGAAREQTAAPGSRWRGLFGAIVLDPGPPPLTRRGAGAGATAELASWPDRPAAEDLIRRRGFVQAAELRATGVDGLPQPVAAGWLADAGHWARLAARLAELVSAHGSADPLAPGLPVDAAREALGMPDRRLVLALAATAPSVALKGGVLTGQGGTSDLPASLAAAVASLLSELRDRPFDAPEAGRLRELGLDKRDLATAARHGALLRLSDQVVLAPDAGSQAARILAGIDQPFTTSQARTALGSTRRTVIPLLEHLDRQRVTQRLPDDRRRIRP